MLGLILAFGGTNADGFLCFAAAVAADRPRSPIWTVCVASGAFATLLIVSIAGSLVVARLGLGVAWLGLVPAAIGVARLVRLWRKRGGGPQTHWLSSAPSIFSIVLATGSDNVAVYAPMFALHSFQWSCGVAAAYLLAWATGCSVLAKFTPNLARIAALERYTEPVLAAFFIAIGLGIAVNGSI